MSKSQKTGPNAKTEKLPWYGSGLRFSCLRCGDCCRGEPGFVWIAPEEIKAAAQFLGLSPAQFKARYVRRAYGRLSLVELENGDCVFWSPAGCKIYPVRPTQCKTFPFWPEYLRSPHAWSMAQRRCPGIGTGKLHTLEDIREKLREYQDK